ncbi:MAG: HD domain-containing protein [Candidatus Caenarcaniphilales bacterium]|nr:HD domain-containing protein [Candidatus Caenarcaniphilales bacterium]
MKKYTLLDPIHGQIEFDTKDPEQALLFALINTPEFQRLRRIRQLGFSAFTFMGAEGSRFIHSIGAMQIMRQMLKALSDYAPEEVKHYQLALMVAALLHDLGHGAFSHSSEPAFGFEHEHWTQKLIRSDSKIHTLLRDYDSKLPLLVNEILAGSAQPSWLCTLVSSQLDCDRADYLTRDSVQTGTKYGLFQLDRIIQNLALTEDLHGQKQVVIREKGLAAVEYFLFARYAMYRQVYHHKKTLSSDALYTSLFKRARDLMLQGQLLDSNSTLRAWLRKEEDLSFEDFLEMDDALIWQYLKAWAKSSADPILGDLADRLLNRRLFGVVPIERLGEAGFQRLHSLIPEPELPYYCLVKECHQFPYNDRKKPILVELMDGEIRELSKVSGISATLTNKSADLDQVYCFAPKEYLAQIQE